MNAWEIILIGIPLVGGGIRGYLNGAVRELMGLSILFLGIWSAYTFSGKIASYLYSYIDEKWLMLTSALIVFIITALLVYVNGWVLEKFLKAVRLNFLNRVGGVLIGIVKWIFVISVLIYLCWEINLKADLVQNSYFQNKVAQIYLQIAQKVLPQKFVDEATNAMKHTSLIK